MEEKTTRSELTTDKLKKALKHRVAGFLPFQLAMFFVFGLCISLPILISAIRDLSNAIAGTDENRSFMIFGNVVGILLTSAIFISFLFPILRNLLRLIKVSRGQFTVETDELERVHEGTDRGCLIALFVLLVSFWLGLLMIAKEVFYFKNGIRYAVTRQDGSSALLGKPGDRFYLVTLRGEHSPTVVYNTGVYELKTENFHTV